MSAVFHNTTGLISSPNYTFSHIVPKEFLDILGAKGQTLFDVARVSNPVTQYIRDLWLPESILNPPTSWSHNQGGVHMEFHYPEKGYSEGKSILLAGGSYLTKHVNTNKFIDAFQSPKLEFIWCIDPWWESDTGFADIVLPAVTNLERNDVSCIGLYDVYSTKCVDNLWESKSDWDIFTELSERLGFKEKFTEGLDEDGWLKRIFDYVDTSKYISWEEFKSRGYYKWEVPNDWVPPPPIIDSRFYQDPDPRWLGTESGKIEIYCRTMSKLYPDDPEVPPIPKYIVPPEGRGSPLEKKYPLYVMTPHTKFAYHASYQLESWLRDEYKVKVGGFEYQPMFISRKDADARDIKDGDIVRAFNDRGEVLFGARVTEKIMPGVVATWYGSQPYSPVEPGKPYSLDRGGLINLITRGYLVSKFDTQSCTTCAAQVERWRG